jgi:threonine 3-dehydrogenase
MKDTMWAVIKPEAAPGLKMTRIPVPEVGHNDVMIKIHKTAICGTDVHIYNWNDWAESTIKPPMTIGHEFVGEIVKMGPGVNAYSIGQLVSGEGHIVCGRCRNCLAGNGHLCRNTKGVGVNRDGAFAEYLIIPGENVRPCSPNIPEEIHSIFDPFGNAVHTALTYDMLGEDVLITGAGPIGIMAAAVSQFSGARNVVITDVNDWRLDLAKKLGIKHTVNVKEQSLPEVMRSLGMQEGFDVGLEMSGSEAGLKSMIDNMICGGRIALLGLLPKDAHADFSKIIFNGLMIKGIYGRKLHETWYKMAALIEAGLDISPIITHRFSIRDFELGFEAMNSGRSGKVILDWSDVNG